MMAERKRLATAWLAGCSGCHISLLDLDEELLDLLGVVDLVACTPLVDAKEVPESDIVLVEGAVSTAADEGRLVELRARAGKLVALGTCAAFGGCQGLRNLQHVGAVLRRAYVDAESNDGGRPPTDVPALLPAVRPLDRVVKVDAAIPGCPPPSGTIRDVLLGLLDGREPVVARRALCDECPRVHRVMRQATYEFLSAQVAAVCELDHIDPELCFLEQGVPCLGLATREGCGGRCLKGNMPCRGCMGPTPQALEQGAKWADAAASLLPAGALSLLEDPVGLGYGFALAASLCPRRVDQEVDAHA
jgi:F420-non-reducing hydrogenase small subunit